MLTHLLSLTSGLMNIFGKTYICLFVSSNFSCILSDRFLYASCPFSDLFSIKYLSNGNCGPDVLTTSPSPPHRCYTLFLSWRKTKIMCTCSHFYFSVHCLLLTTLILLCASYGNTSFRVSNLLMTLALIIPFRLQNPYIISYHPGPHLWLPYECILIYS